MTEELLSWRVLRSSGKVSLFTQENVLCISTDLHPKRGGSRWMHHRPSGVQLTRIFHHSYEIDFPGWSERLGRDFQRNLPAQVDFSEFWYTRPLTPII
jgi:hypothetical protein